MSTPEFTTVGLVGTGAMGRGIAQIAAQAGAVVRLLGQVRDDGAHVCEFGVSGAGDGPRAHVHHGPVYGHVGCRLGRDR